MNFRLMLFSLSNKSVKKKIIDYDNFKTFPTDNVWMICRHRRKIYTMEEAVQNHREMHHPTVLNCPNSEVNAKIELNLEVNDEKL